MIDPLVSLAFGVHSNKGVYALLLGSGVSRSAGIPTGWEVVVDLCRKLAAAEGADPNGDPAAWYRGRFGKDPDYSELLDELGRTPSERQQLLRGYFEPTEEEKALGEKLPTPAHRAIAKLMAKGYVRVALTTNFDRLLERAIEDEGISPVIVSTVDAIAGAVPLVHQKCCIVKLHGDYLDTRIKNTPAELGGYEPALTRLLAQVLDEFGLVVCGWSAEYDDALRAAIEACPTRRFSTYWATRGDPRPVAKKLIAQRSAETVQIESADKFFERLADLVSGIEQSSAPRADTLEALAALVKRYLSLPAPPIALSDLLHEEVEAARKSLASINTDFLRASPQPPLDDLLRQYMGAIARVQTILIHGASFAGSALEPLWAGAIERIATPEKSGGTVVADRVRLVPAIVLLYSAGVASIAAERYGTLRALLTRPRLSRLDGRRVPLVSGQFWGDMSGALKLLPAYADKYLPRSEFLFGAIREPLRRYLPDDAAYDGAFDEFEILLAMLYLDLNPDTILDRRWAPPGRFAWKARRTDDGALTEMAKAIEARGEHWPPTQSGLFESAQRAKELHGWLTTFVASLPF